MANEQLPPASNGSSNLVDVLEKVLDKGVVIAGDIRVGIADVELLTIKIRLIVASVDKAKEMGLDWWETDPYLTSRATDMKIAEQQNAEAENKELQKKVEALENKLNEQNEAPSTEKSSTKKASDKQLDGEDKDE
ncbi:gas vesicle protein [Staphylococcus simulans]|uniref:gas vesicle protein n=1 Tax=Staphylococcus simulans TaxID=1286 RepID=UPI000D1D358E|nr:gas vesicle protein [Staphylococcus simulans]PTJ21367.1 gas vesicle protein [Staphylococcus simulans]